MLKILQLRLQQYVSQEFPDLQARFRKGRGTRDQITNIHWITEKAREFQKTICFTDYTKAFDCVDHNKLWKNSSRETKPPYLCPEKPVCRSRKNRITDETSDWFKIGKGVHQGYILSTCIFNFYAKYILRSAGLNEPQGGIKIAGRNINNLRYADDTTLTAESEEELKGLFMKVKEESEKTVLKLNTQKAMITASNPNTSWQTGGEKVEPVTDFLVLQNHCG